MLIIIAKISWIIDIIKHFLRTSQVQSQSLFPVCMVGKHRGQLGGERWSTWETQGLVTGTWWWHEEQLVGRRIALEIPGWLPGFDSGEAWGTEWRVVERPEIQGLVTGTWCRESGRRENGWQAVERQGDIGAGYQEIERLVTRTWSIELPEGSQSHYNRRQKVAFVLMTCQSQRTHPMIRLHDNVGSRIANPSSHTYKCISRSHNRMRTIRDVYKARFPSCTEMDSNSWKRKSSE